MSPVRSRLGGGLRIGADFHARRGAICAADPEPRGVVDRISDLAHPGIDTGRIHPAIAAFFEDTAGLELAIESRWRFPFSIAWRVFRPVMRWIGQFVLPKRTARILTEVRALDPKADGRPDARAVIRRYAGSGEVMQVVGYATWERGGARYMSASFPLPGGQILGILRLDPIGDGSTGVVLSSARRRGDDAGVRAAIGPLVIRAPLGEQIELHAIGADGSPDEPAPPGFSDASLFGRHRQSILGIRFATHLYWFRRVDRAPPPRS